MGSLRESGDDRKDHDGMSVGRGTVGGVYLQGAPCCVVVSSGFSGERIEESATLVQETRCRRVKRNCARDVLTVM
jgi:hypothetical protein